MAREIELDAARHDLNALIDALLAGGEPVALVEAGKPCIVLLSFEDYDLLVGAVQQLSREWEGGAL